jgi:4-amino-4-deoxy-L-arabinose transferase-like glycosyltransferase
MKDKNRQFYFLLFILALAVNFTGIDLKFFTDDPALYASIAKNLIYKKDFLQLFTYNQDWLDKPHFPFWVVMCSFKLFGISEWAYRLPALLFFMLSLLYTYLFTKKFYGYEIAMMAVLILTTAQSIIMSNTDVRAEPYLMALVIGSMYHIAWLNERYSFADLFFAALLTACAIMTKGLFVIVAIYGGLLGQLIFQKRFKNIFSLKWIALFLLTAIFILPECYALYVQFDMHPEKVVFGRQNVSGIKWFLWDSQFGRFVNNGPIQRKSADVFFFVHTLLWAFAPWCLLFYFALYKNFKEIFQKRKLTEYYTLSGGVLLLLLFSLSRFQLPFYTNTIFPLFAVITAPYCYTQLNKVETRIRLISMWPYIILFPIAILLINFFSRPAHAVGFAVDCILFGLVIFFITTEVEQSYKKVFMLNCAAAIFVNLYLNTVFYNQIIVDKGEITAAEYVNQKQFDNYHLYSLRTANNIFQFYCKRPVDFIPLEQFNTFKPADSSAFYMNQESMDYLLKTHAAFKLIKTFTEYPQENILPDFIDRNTRYKVLGLVYLITK